MNRLSWTFLPPLLLALVLGSGCEDPADLLPPCPTDAEFHAALVDPWVGDKCGSCHKEGGSAGGTGFLLDGSTEANLAAFVARADVDVDGLPLLLLKPTNLHPDGHGGGQVLTPSSPEYGDLVTFVARLRDDIDDCGQGSAGDAPGLDDCDGAVPGRRVLRRLSHVEYAHTVEDLLGVAGGGLHFAPDVEVHGYLNSASALDVPPLLLEQYRDAAEDLSAQAVAEEWDELMPCSDPTAACAATFIEEFGRRAFRRPLTVEDRDRYLSIFTVAATDEGFRAGIRWVIATMLQSPHFLYRSELGTEGSGGFTLTDWELATELSYLVLQTTPDDALLDAAASGALSTPEGLAAELERLTALPGAAGTMEQFVGHWLLLDRLPVVARDPDLYPELTDSVRGAMAAETGRVVRDVSARGGSLADLLLGAETFLDPELAAFYGVPLGTGEADPQGFVRTPLDGTGRGGLLTQGSLLTVHALPNGSSPIHRGVLVRERLLCQELPPPPANIDASPPPIDPSQSTRERYAAHSAIDECASCHVMIDPIGFAFEHFDGVGRWRETEGPHTIDDRGEIVGSPHSDGPFEGVGELSALLAESVDVEECYGHQWVTFGTGLGEELACSAEAVADRIAAEGGRLDAVFVGIVDLPHFRVRTGEPGELGAPPVGPGALPTLDDDTEFSDDTPSGGDGELDVDLSLNDWGAGYCADVTVTNTTDAVVAWEVELELEGTINNHWNAEMTALAGNLYRFAGVAWNAEIAPGESAGFGLCAAR